jgi:hypothetical protein
MFWDRAQARPQDGYFFARPAVSMFVGVSRCPADYRMSAGFDPCKRVESSAALNWTTKPNFNPLVCSLLPGLTYYYTIGAQDPTDGLTIGEHTCEPISQTAGGCDVQIVHRPQ